MQQKMHAHFLVLIGDTIRTNMTFCLLSRWLGLRLDALSYLVIFITCYSAVFLRAFFSPSTVGLALVYVMCLSY